MSWKTTKFFATNLEPFLKFRPELSFSRLAVGSPPSHRSHPTSHVLVNIDLYLDPNSIGRDTGSDRPGEMSGRSDDESHSTTRPVLRWSRSLRGIQEGIVFVLIVNFLWSWCLLPIPLPKPAKSPQIIDLESCTQTGVVCEGYVG